MQLLQEFKLILIVLVLVNKILCFCENSYIVICDDLEDIKQNETTSWKYVLIGSSQTNYERPNNILDGSVTLSLARTKSLTIINQLKLIRTPISIVRENYLEYLNLYDNDINEIDDYTFQNLPNLKEVYLERNKIGHLGRGIFQNTTLEVVNLSRNRIKSITTCFYHSKIKWILLNENKISFIKPRAFPQEVEQLELNDNLLESIEGTVFENLHNLKELFLQRNLLTQIPDISALKKIHYLHFAYNNVKLVDYPFNNHKDLEFLDLSSNLIKNVTVEVFSSDRTPPLVLLPFNRLTNLKFNNPERKTDLVLYGNPWNCDCLFRIEKILVTHKHYKSCEFDFFRNGKLPMCVGSGKCEDDSVESNDIQNFIDMIISCEDRSLCNFRL
jgi:hypothetical protein